MSTWSTTPTADAFCSGIDVLQNTNFGSNSIISAIVAITGDEKSAWSRAYINFDLSAFPSTSGDIVSAKLVLQILSVNSPGETINCDRIRGHDDGDDSPDASPADWVEDEITWIDFDADPSAWTEAGGDFDTTDRVTFLVPASPSTYDVPGFKDMVIDAIDSRSDLLSVVVWLDDEAAAGNTRGIAFNSREEATGKPKLVITYGAVAVAPHAMDYRRRRMTV